MQSQAKITEVFLKIYGIILRFTCSKDVYKLVLKIFDYTKDFPREYKHTLGQDMKRDSIQLVRSIYRANKAKEKRAYLETFLDVNQGIGFQKQ